MWGAGGGAAVALILLVVFAMSRSGPPRGAVASVSSSGNGGGSMGNPAPAAPAPTVDAAAGVATPAAAVTGATGRTIDLLPHIDVERDRIAGAWRIERGALMSEASHRARIGIRYPLPREYDFRVQFTQVDGDNCAVQMFTAGNPAAFIIGGWKRTVTGFQQIAGRWANSNLTGVRGIKFENGQMHTSVVRVRKDSIEAWLDGKRIAAYATDGSDLSNRDWEIGKYPLGVGSEVTSTVFHRIELIEVGSDAAASAR
jgi:hypothetical protein